MRDWIGKERKDKNVSVPGLHYQDSHQFSVGRRSWLGRWERESKKKNGFGFGYVEFDY